MNRPAIPVIKLLFASLVLLAAAASAGAELKLAFVRSGYILKNYEPYQDALKKYQEFEKTEIEKLQKRASDFQQKVADSQKQAAFMTEDKIKERSSELERENAELEQQYNQLHDRQEGVLATKYAEFLKPVFDQVNKVIFQVRKDEGYDFIFEAESNALLDADDKYDISDKIVQQLKQLPPPTPAKEAPKKDATKKEAPKKE